MYFVEFWCICPTNAIVMLLDKYNKKLICFMFIGLCIILTVKLRETNLMSLALLFLYLMLNMFRMLIHPSSGACDLCAELFHGLH